MASGSAEAIFALARTAGWLAHAGEEYAHHLRYRIRAAYTGPSPPSVAAGPAVGS
jgi:citrate synthase